MFKYTIDDSLHLKMLDLQDAESLFSLTEKSKSELVKWLPLIADNTCLEDTQRFIKSTIQRFAENNGFSAGIWYQGDIAGVISFHHINWHNLNTSIGYWLGSGFEGRGLMTKSCAALISYAFSEWKLNRVEIRAASDNWKSRRIPERLGFTEEGCIRQAQKINGRYVDHMVYGMLANEWTFSE
ncbi:GNAT family N-acetyltransferase [Sediminibacillus massiliensis]|uniref:GNAT family N-acetyltransferase n=1 Tax=Sediminibacillus massiliensis TaxID=1926277 RepID=UPI0009887A5A|nr:GNAT family protein [Sediminibacillus massiliensis]